MSKIWFTADMHFGHKNIIKYCNRPFDTVEQMDAVLIDNWNRRVAPDDHVYVVGDFTFNRNRVPAYLERLLGKKTLIVGNHDKDPDVSLGWHDVKSYHEMYHHNKFIVLCHYAMRVWNKSHHGSYMLYGHSHGGLPGNGNSLDVGVDCWDYSPVSFSEIMKKCEQQKDNTNETGHH